MEATDRRFVKSADCSTARSEADEMRAAGTFALAAYRPELGGWGVLVYKWAGEK